MSGRPSIGRAVLEHVPRASYDTYLSPTPGCVTALMSYLHQPCRYEHVMAISGAAFRRALRQYVGLTPSAVRAFGGLRVVLSRFLDACGLPDSLRGDRVVA